VAQIRGCGGSDTVTWWLRFRDVVAQIRGRAGHGMWWLRYGGVVAQIQRRGGSDTKKCWLRYGDVVAQIWGRGGSDGGT
jgi:hypothetical protein